MKGFIIVLGAALLILSAGCGNGGTDEGANLPADDTSAAGQRVEIDSSLSQPQVPVIYYRFAESGIDTYPDKSVTILEDELVLIPVKISADSARDPASRIVMALQAMMDDTGNVWTGDDLDVAGVSFEDGRADVQLLGSIYAPGDIVLIAARMQFVMTVFADPDVQTATITLDGECIGNLGISHESEECPADYLFTREEIDIL
jgi:hypothetical protein